MSMTPEHTFHDDPEGYICALQNRIDALTAALERAIDGDDLEAKIQAAAEEIAGMKQDPMEFTKEYIGRVAAILKRHLEGGK